MCAAIVACATALLAASVAHAQSETLRLLRNRGELRCGVSEGITGFSRRAPDGTWSGIDVDFCRAAAAAALGDASRVHFVALTAPARFPALLSGEIDVLARNTTWTVQREAVFGISFIGILFYDNQAFLARADSRFAQSDSIEGARICVERSSNHLLEVQTYAKQKALHVSWVVTPDFASARSSLESGACDLMSDDRAAMANLTIDTGDHVRFVVRPERIGRQPLSPAVRNNDGGWVTFLRAVYAVLLNAESRGIGQAEAADILKHPHTLDHEAFLDRTDEIARALQLDPFWAARAVAAVGNYGEMFARNLGERSPLRLPRGPNRPVTDGGLLFAPQLQ